MRATDIIIRKRGEPVISADGRNIITAQKPLTREEIEFIVAGCTDGSIPRYQISAWLMAVYFNGMTFGETGLLTDAMLRSGDTINLHGRETEGLCGPFVDKHSTGGVGDKISIPLAPIAAACGLQVPMMSGRALGHTGGTLDKLESIEGYRTNLSPEEFAALIADNGYAMTGQTDKIAPADRIMYALRDVTGTVESVPLITASILSKKLAEGSDALVFDVKYGSGAFMKTPEAAETLASFLVNTAAATGKKATALLTCMDTPLGMKTGNFLEIEESVECLRGTAPDDIMEETFALGAEMLVLGGIASDTAAAREMCREAVSSGRALDRFLRNVEAQGGNPERLMSQIGKRRSGFHAEFKAEKDGFISVDAYGIGLAGITLGIGRATAGEQVCPDAGIIFRKKTGDAVRAGETVMEVFSRDSGCLEPAMERISKAVSYSDERRAPGELILKKITEGTDAN